MKMQHTSRCSNCLGHIAYVQLGRRASPVSPSRPGPPGGGRPSTPGTGSVQRFQEGSGGAYV